MKWKTNNRITERCYIYDNQSHGTSKVDTMYNTRHNNYQPGNIRCNDLKHMIYKYNNVF